MSGNAGKPKNRPERIFGEWLFDKSSLASIADRHLVIGQE
jgi:hypothetical protein